MLFDMSTNSAAQVANGYISFTFPKFEKVLNALVYFDQSTNVSGDMSGGFDVSTNVAPDTSLNMVQVWPYIRKLGVRTAAVTSDLTGKKFVVLVNGT